MSDSTEAPAVLEATPDTPVEESPDTPQPEGHVEADANDPYEKRYKDVQSAFTKASQEAKELREWKERLSSDEDAQREFLAELGYGFEDDNTGIKDDAETDPVTAVQQEWEAFKQAQQQAAEQEQWNAFETHVKDSFKEYGEERGHPLTDQEERFLIGAVLTAEAGEDGVSPVKAVLDAYGQLQDDLKKSWVGTKQAPAAPSGVAASEMPDLDNDEQRQQWMMERIRSNSG